MQNLIYEEGVVARKENGGALAYRKEVVDGLEGKARLDFFTIEDLGQKGWKAGDKKMLDNWVKYLRSVKCPFVVKEYKTVLVRSL